MKFKVGDVCIVKDCNCRPGTPAAWVGKECTIISVDTNDPDGVFYETDLSPHDGYTGPYEHAWACANCLEIKQPPGKREELGEWDLCPWQPERVTVSEEAKHG